MNLHLILTIAAAVCFAAAALNVKSVIQLTPLGLLLLTLTLLF